MTLNNRRTLGVVVLLVGCILIGAINSAWVTHLRRAELGSGLLLLGIVLILTLFNARKKLPFLPLLRASTWMQVHIYAGYFAVWLFWLHVGGRMPTGGLEVTLAILFVAVAGSGVAGIAITRWMPSRMTIHGENLLYERIPALRASVRREAEELVAESVAATNSSTIADFYEGRLQRYFSRNRFFLSHIVGHRKPLYKLLGEVEALDRYLNSKEREIMVKIMDLIRAKENLDFQRACQSMLKGWLFVHIPLTYSLILFALVHGVMAWLFS